MSAKRKSKKPVYIQQLDSTVTGLLNIDLRQFTASDQRRLDRATAYVNDVSDKEVFRDAARNP